MIVEVALPAANRNVQFHGRVMEKVYRCNGNGVPSVFEAGAPTENEMRWHDALGDRGWWSSCNGCSIG